MSLFRNLLRTHPFLIVLAVSAIFSPPTRAQSWSDDCGQIIVVVTQDWAAPTGRMASFERKGSSWKAVRAPVSVTVGHKGLGWGLGLHRPRLDSPQKREGDKRAPAGIFRLEFGFGAKPLQVRSFPYHLVSERDFWVDDPASRFYNQWVVGEDARFPKDWSSAEILKRRDGIYDHVIVVAHNRGPVTAGRGSAIFMHSWFGPGKSTIGCTAMEKAEVKRLLGWLEAAQQPVLIQVPQGEFGGLALPEALFETIRKTLPFESGGE